jgi:hypothetical protein
MSTIQKCKDFSHALGEYLQQADYYSQGMKVEGQCFGRLCDAVVWSKERRSPTRRLTGSSAITMQLRASNSRSGCVRAEDGRPSP